MLLQVVQELSDIQAAFIERLPWALIAMQSGHSNVEQNCAAEKKLQQLSEVHNLSLQSRVLPQAERPVYPDPLAGVPAHLPLVILVMPQRHDLHSNSLKKQGLHCCYSKLITPLCFSMSLSISPSLNVPINLKSGAHEGSSNSTRFLAHQGPNASQIVW